MVIILPGRWGTGRWHFLKFGDMDAFAYYAEVPLDLMQFIQKKECCFSFIFWHTF